MVEKFITILQTTFTEQYSLIETRVIYAICVDEIECWLLPLFYSDKIKAATNNCIYHLNRKAKEQFGFYIDVNDKSNSGNNYHKLSKRYLKKRDLKANFDKNVSLKIFIESVDAMNISW